MQLSLSKSMKGFGPRDIFETMFSILLVAYVFFPVVNPAIASAVAGMDPSGQFYTIVVILLDLIDVVVLIVILMGIYQRAFPTYSNQYGG